MTIPGFDAAQFAYENRMPDEPKFGYCVKHNGSFEDCWDEHEDPEKDNAEAMDDEADAYWSGVAEDRAMEDDRYDY